jgi:hypothetical protein
MAVFKVQSMTTANPTGLGAHNRDDS